MAGKRRNSVTNRIAKILLRNPNKLIPVDELARKSFGLSPKVKVTRVLLKATKDCFYPAARKLENDGEGAVVREYGQDRSILGVCLQNKAQDNLREIDEENSVKRVRRSQGHVIRLLQLLRNTGDYKLLTNVNLNQIVYGLLNDVAAIGNKPKQVLSELEETNIAGMLLERNEEPTSGNAKGVHVIDAEIVEEKAA